MANSTLIFISGSSGVGKNTIINSVINRHPELCQFLVSNTTRAKRESDRKDGQYKFVTKEQFLAKIDNGEMLEYDVYNDNYYGIDSEEVLSNANTGKVLLKDLTVRGMLKSRLVLGDKLPQIGVFVTEKKKVLRERLINRGEKDIKSRLKVYGAEQKMSRHYDYIVRNCSLEKSVNEVEAIINTEHNNLPLLTAVSTQCINDKRIDKVSAKLQKGAKVSPIKVVAKDNRIYIVEGTNTYLASLRTGKRVIKQFVDNVVTLPSENEQQEWVRIVQSYK